MNKTQTPSSNQLVDRTLGGFFWIFSGTGAQAAFQFLTLIVLARLVTPEDFGVVNAAMVVIGFSMIFAHLGVGPALVQRDNLEERHLRTGLTISLLFALLLTVLIIVTAPLIAGFFRIEALTHVLRVLAFVFPLQAVAVVGESLLQRHLKFRVMAMIQVFSFLLGYGLVGIGLALLGLGVWALVGAHLSQNLLTMAMVLIKQPVPLRLQFERKAFQELLYFGSGFTLAKIGNYIALQGDNLVVGRWLGPEALGLYGRAYQLMVMPATLFGQVMDKVLFPAMAKVQNEQERLAKTFRRGVAAVGLLTLPLTAGVVILAPEIILVLLGENWTAAIVPLQILALGTLFRTSYKISDSLVRAKGAVYRRAWRQWVYAGAVLSGAYAGHYWGLTGVAVGIVSALLLNFILMAALSLDLTHIPLKQFLAAHLPGLWLGIVVCLELLALSPALRGYGLPPLVVLIISVSVVAVSVLLLVRIAPRFFLGEDGLWAYRKVKEFVHKRLQKTGSKIKQKKQSS